MAEERQILDLLERAAEHIHPQDVRFARAGFHVAASMLAWRVFWELADRNNDNRYAQTLAWTVVCVALWIVSRY